MKRILLLTFLVFFGTISHQLHAQTGFNCDGAIVIPSLPYQTIDNTANYAPGTDSPQAISCGATPLATNYKAGKQAYYTYTPTTSGNVSIVMTPVGSASTNSGIFVYENCGTVCVAGQADPTTQARTLNLNAVQGQEYIIVVSSAVATPTIGYNLLIQDEACTPKPTGGIASAMTQTSATISWNYTNGSSWQVAVQPAGATVPTGAGETATTTILEKTGLTPGTAYQFWIRVKCSSPSNTFSAWAGPFFFNTVICEPANKCNYTFSITDNGFTDWNTARMQIRQNGIVVGIIGTSYPTNGTLSTQSVALCKDVPFEIYWNTPGIHPELCSLKVMNSFGQVLFSKPAGTGSPETILYNNGPVNCTSPICNIKPAEVAVANITATDMQVNWASNGASAWDIYIAPSGSSLPTAFTLPTYTNITTKPFTPSLPLNSNTAYTVYVRTNCGSSPSSEWSDGISFTTLTSCFRPTVQSLGGNSATLTSAVLSWIPSPLSDSTSWEVLIIPGPATPATPLINPVVGSGSFLIPASDTPSLTVNNLQPGTPYYYYIRTVCSATDKSLWSDAYQFNTIICSTADKCNYKFIMTDTAANGWNGARMQVRQNGIVIQTIGQSITGGGPTTVTVALCKDIPFELYWNEQGTAPAEIGVSIQNPFTDILYTKTPGSGTPLQVLYTGVSTCNPPSCPKPSALDATAITQTSAQLSWAENGSAAQWEIYAVVEGAPLPVNGSPLNGGTAYHISNNPTYTLTGLLPATSYTFYVRALCSATDISTWTILNPKKFITNSVNDECIAAIPLPVNPTIICTQIVNGTTLGATASVQTSEVWCTGSDAWYSFVATSTTHIINILNVTGSSSSGLKYSLYSGDDCFSLTQLYCLSSPAGMNVAKNLIIGATYKIRISSGTISPITLDTYRNFQIGISTPESITNDECSNAIPITVNELSKCDSIAYGSVTTATASPQPSNCPGAVDDDVWFSFTGTSGTMQISLFDISGSTTNLNYGIYTGECSNLTFVSCSPATATSSVTEGFVEGQTYYLRVWSNSAAAAVAYFSVCIKPISSCYNAEPFCGSSSADPYIYQNSTGIPSTQEVMGCLNSTPNPTYYTLHVGETGPLSFNILQNTLFDPNGNPIGNNLDVDFIAWGPFTSPQSCGQIATGACAPVSCPNNTSNPLFYPNGNIVDCSYDGSFTETLSIPNAQAGQYYIVLITNFSGQQGFIRLTQTNFSEPNAGHTYCEDKIQLVSFVDTNGNGIKENDEINFTLGNFIYQKNNTGAIHNISSPTGKYTVLDSNPLNTYDFSFQINPEFASYYAMPATNFNDLTVVIGGGSNILYFPVTVLQPYTDLDVSIIPLLQPRAGFNYKNLILYRNLSTSPASGTLTFTKSPAVTITAVSQPAAVVTPTGFTLDYNSLAAFETRYLTVSMDIPSIPLVSLGQTLTNRVAIPVLNDNNNVNNTAILSQVITGSYDPNDKTEAHGGKVEFTQFNQNDYLFYTIRFQNTGTASAITVRVEDLLDAKLDETSIRMISSSHNYIMERINNKLVWTFNNIQLPGAFQNEELSQGYVTFKIRLKPGFALGDIIANTADIYFDTNPAIITNTVETEFSTNLGTPGFTAGNIMVYPNPANSRVQISVMNTNETIDSIVLYDMLGKTVSRTLNVGSQMTSIDVSAFAKGVYMIEILTGNKFRQVKKLVIE